MHTGATCVSEHDTITVSAQRMHELDVGALPICGDDDRLHGIVTDRDIVTDCVAVNDGRSVTTVGELAQGSVWWG